MLSWCYNVSVESSKCSSTTAVEVFLIKQLYGFRDKHNSVWSHIVGIFAVYSDLERVNYGAKSSGTSKKISFTLGSWSHIFARFEKQSRRSSNFVSALTF